MMRTPFLLSLCSLAFCSIANAAPTVSDVKRPTPDDATIEITGSGFGEGPNVVVFDQFEKDGVEGATIPLNRATQGQWNSIESTPTYDSLAHSGKFSARTWVNSQMGQFAAALPQGTTSVLLSYWVHIPPNTPFPGANFSGSKIRNWSTDSSWKLAWLYDQSYRGEDADVCLPTHVGHGIFQINGNDGVGFGDAENRVGIQPNWWNWDHWMRMTIWLRANTSDPVQPGDWYFNVVSQGKQPSTYAKQSPVFDQDGAAIKQFRTLHIPGWFKESSDPATRPLYDDIYLAVGPNSAARVEIGDAPQLSQVSALEIQPITSWSDGKISLKLNPGGLKNLRCSYLYITDQNNVTNATGIPLFNCPAVPGDVTGDQVVDARDLQLVQRHVLGGAALTNEQIKNADLAPVMVPDNKVDTSDLIKVQRKVLGIAQ